MDDFYAARSSTSPPPPWSNFAPPFSPDLDSFYWNDPAARAAAEEIWGQPLEAAPQA